MLVFAALVNDRLTVMFLEGADLKLGGLPELSSCWRRGWGGWAGHGPG